MTLHDIAELLQELAKLAKNGDENAFVDLVNLAAIPTYEHIRYKYADNDEDAKEMCNDAFQMT